MKRTFRDIRKRESSPDDFTVAWERGPGEEGIGWDELLKSQRILLVSEAGVGKTYERQQLAASLARIVA